MGVMRLLLIVHLLVTGCSAAEGPDPLMGGEIAVESCGYTVRTPDGASRPKLAGELAGANPAPFAVHLAVGRNPSSEVTVVWRTRDDQTEATTVQLGDQSIEGFTFYYPDQATDKTIRIHEAHLCGLQPDTEYRYQVGGAGVFSAEYKFRTAPDRAKSPDAEIYVLTIGDTRGGYGTFKDTLSQALKGGLPDLVLFNGDAIVLGLAQDEWDQWFAAAEALLPNVPMAFAHGNHEVNALNWFAQFANPGDEQNFGFDFGPAHVTVLNDTTASAGDVTGKVAAFFDDDMGKNAGAPWKVTLHHKTLWSATTVHPPDPVQRASWGAIMDKHHVDVDLAGHDHDYERSKPLKNLMPAASAKDGTIYVTVGSAGAPLYDAKVDFFTQISETTYSYMLLRVRTGRLQADAFRGDGTPLDSFAIMKP